MTAQLTVGVGRNDLIPPAEATHHMLVSLVPLYALWNNVLAPSSRNTSPLQGFLDALVPGPVCPIYGVWILVPREGTTVPLARRIQDIKLDGTTPAGQPPRKLCLHASKFSSLFKHMYVLLFGCLFRFPKVQVQRASGLMSLMSPMVTNHSAHQSKCPMRCQHDRSSSWYVFEPALLLSQVYLRLCLRMVASCLLSHC